MTTTTVAGNKMARIGPGKFNNIAVTAAPLYGTYSVHDCADPGQMSAMNSIFPQNFAVDDNPNGVTVRYGIYVHSRSGSGTFVVTHST